MQPTEENAELMADVNRDAAHPTLAEALVAIQDEAPTIPLDAENPHFHSKFASLAGVMDRVRPVTTRNGVAIVQLPTTVDGAPGLTTRLVHVSGEQIESTMLLLPAKSDPQGQGAALTYARRYMVLAMLGLVGDEDDDGNAAALGQPAASPEGIGTAAAKKLVDRAWEVGVKDKLRLAVSHMRGGSDVGDIGTKAKAIKALAALTFQESEKLDSWLSKKADEAATKE